MVTENKNSEIEMVELYNVHPVESRATNAYGCLPQQITAETYSLGREREKYYIVYKIYIRVTKKRPILLHEHFVHFMHMLHCQYIAPMHHVFDCKVTAFNNSAIRFGRFTCEIKREKIVINGE